MSKDLSGVLSRPLGPSDVVETCKSLSEKQKQLHLFLLNTIMIRLILCLELSSAQTPWLEYWFYRLSRRWWKNIPWKRPRNSIWS